MTKFYVTSKYEGYRHETIQFDTNKDSDSLIQIDPSTKFQKIMGFGGAFTESACYTLNKLSATNQEQILNAYFNPETGLKYNLGRIHMNSCDFSLGNYTYVKDYDEDLVSFDISREYKYVIPTIKRAEEIAKKPIELLISPWSPPAWMKTNNQMNHGGELLPKYFQSWANYYVKFLEEVKNAQLTSFALTVQNEPAAVQTWDSCIYDAEDERDFVKNYLGPTLAKSSFKDTKIFIWDHNRDIIVERAKGVLSDPLASKYVAGTAVHWYVSEEFKNLSTVHELFPDKQIIFSEGCIEGGPHPNIYETGERYARNIIGDFSNWCEAFIDWNLTLDELGGPNHVGNYCDAPILSDTISDELIINSSYYHIGHFSKHVLPGAYRIKSVTDNTLVKQIAFLNPDNSIVLVCLNETEKDQIIRVNIDKNEFKFTSLKRSITTFIDKGDL